MQFAVGQDFLDCDNCGHKAPVEKCAPCNKCKQWLCHGCYQYPYDKDGEVKSECCFSCSDSEDKKLLDFVVRKYGLDYQQILRDYYEADGDG